MAEKLQAIAEIDLDERLAVQPPLSSNDREAAPRLAASPEAFPKKLRNFPEKT
jgi:hypothetical protein